MVICSAGYLDTSGTLDSLRDSSNVRPPTLPKNIRHISIRCEYPRKNGVTPSVTPTVPIAEAVSNNASFMVMPSIHVIAAPEAAKRDI